MTGKTCVVTGATSGIGWEIARILAQKGARVIGVGRSLARCSLACRGIAEATGSREVFFETADLSVQSEIRALAGRLLDRTRSVDVLVNNAGTFTLTRRETSEGIESQLAVNWLAGYMLAGLLLPLLRAAPSARVITVSSGSHFSGRIHWDDIQLRRGYNGLKAYDQSKLATVLYTRELARRLGPGSTVSACAVDPGLVKTDIGAKGNGALVKLVWRMRIRRGITPRQAAEAVTYCALNQSAGERSGLYWKECRPQESSPLSRDPADAARLWDLGRELCGVHYP